MKKKEDTIQAKIEKCKMVFYFCPFATKVYIALKTGISISFINEHSKEIGLS